MKKYFYMFIGTALSFLLLVSCMVVAIDPFFHFHAPLKSIYYELSNARSQGMGIAKNYEYDAIITGSSLTQSFKTSDFDSLFGTNAVKIPFPGATFYETEKMLETAFESGNDIKYVLRSLDLNHLTDDKDALRKDLGEYPFYLYNDSIWDDYKYFLNEDVIVTYCLPELWGLLTGKKGGHTSFDVFMLGPALPARWYYSDTPFDASGIEKERLGDEEKENLVENVTTNIVDLAKAHPETTFIYFIAPYNEYWWLDQIKEGRVDYVCDEMETAMELMTECDNIELYCYADMTDITTDLNYYVDSYHFIRSLHPKILGWIHDKEHLVTKDNYREYVDMIRQFYSDHEYYVERFAE